MRAGDTWFIEPGMGIRTLKDLTNVYHQTVGRNGVLEMDFAIDRTGRVVRERRPTEHPSGSRVPHNPLSTEC